MSKHFVETAQYLLRRGVISSASLLKDTMKSIDPKNGKIIYYNFNEYDWRLMSIIVKGGHKSGAALWKKITFFAAFPSVLIVAAATYIQHNSHEERQEFIAYEHLSKYIKINT